MKALVHSYVSNKYVIIAVLLTSCILSFFIPSVPFIAGFGFALITLWSSGWEWPEFGVRSSHLWHTVLSAFAYAIILFVAVAFIVTPIFELTFGEVYYGSFEWLRGNGSFSLFFLFFTWLVVVVTEEFVFRGYYLKHIAKAFGHSRLAWIVAAVLSSVIFGLAHQNLGVSGVFQTGIVGIVLSYFFYHEKQNLTLLIFIHGFYNTIWIILTYLNSERVITEYLLKVFK